MNLFRFLVQSFVLVLALASCGAKVDTSQRPEAFDDAGDVGVHELPDAPSDATIVDVTTGSLEDSGAGMVEDGPMVGEADDARRTTCMPLAVNNPEGVGTYCSAAIIELACPASRYCTDDLSTLGVRVDGPGYCTKPCLQDSECGDGLRCCSPYGATRKICILDGCPGACP